MHNIPCQRPPEHTHCNVKPTLVFEPECIPNNVNKYSCIKVPFKNGRLLLEDDIVGNYIRKNATDSNNKPVVEKVESQLQYTKRPVYIKPKPVEKTKVGKVLVKHVNPVTGKVTYEIQDNIPAELLKEYNEEVNKESIKDNEFITYGDIKNIIDSEMNRVYARLTALETTMTKVLRILHYLQNGVLPPYKDEITLPKPGEPIPDLPSNELPPLTEYVPPYTPDPEPEEPEDPDKVIDVVIKVGDVVTPIFPGEEDKPVDPDNPDVKPEEPTPITPVVDVVLNANEGDIVTDYILTLPFVVYDPEHTWKKLTLLVKTPGKDYFAVVKELELIPDPDVDGNQNAVVYYVPKEVGTYDFKLVHYVTAVNENNVETEVAVDLKDFSYEVLARDVNDPIPAEDITINNNLLVEDPTHVMVVGDTVEYEFIANHPEKITGVSTLAITDPGSIAPIETRTLKFNVSKGKMRAKEVVEFTKQDEYKFELSMEGIEQPTIWYVNVSEDVPVVPENPDNTGDTGDTDVTPPEIPDPNPDGDTTVEPNPNPDTGDITDNTGDGNGNTGTDVPPVVDNPTTDNTEETNPDPGTTTEDFNRVTTTTVVV